MKKKHVKYLTIDELQHTYSKKQLLRIFRYCRINKVLALTKKEIKTVLAMEANHPKLKDSFATIIGVKT